MSVQRYDCQGKQDDNGYLCAFKHFAFLERQIEVEREILKECREKRDALAALLAGAQAALSCKEAFETAMERLAGAEKEKDELRAKLVSLGECDDPECNGGWIPTFANEGDPTQCPKCWKLDTGATSPKNQSR